MLDWMITLALLGIGTLGYYAMRRLDASLDGMAVISHEDLLKRASVLLFVDENVQEEALAALLAMLDVESIPYTLSKTSLVQDLQSFSHIMALSDNDLDNLLLCQRARRVRPDVETVASCSRYVYRSVYKEHGVDWIVSGKQDPALLSIVSALGAGA